MANHSLAHALDLGRAVADLIVPLAEGGTAILLHRFQRHFSHPTQQPYRAFFAGTRAGGPDASALAEGRFASDEAAVDAQRRQDEMLDHETPLGELFCRPPFAPRP